MYLKLLTTTGYTHVYEPEGTTIEIKVHAKNLDEAENKIVQFIQKSVYLDAQGNIRLKMVIDGGDAE